MSTAVALQAPVITDQKSMETWVGKVTVALAAAQGMPEKLQLVEHAAGELRAGLEAMKKTQLDRAQDAYQATGTDADVVRSYWEPALEAEEHDFRVTDLGSQGAQITRAHNFAGRDGVGAVRLFGGYEYGRYEPGLLDDPAPKSNWQHDLQRAVDELSLAKAFSRSGRASTKYHRAIGRLLRRGPPQIRHLFADNATEGGEFVADVVLPELQRTAELARNLEKEFPRMQLRTGGSNTNPFMTAGAQPFIRNAPTAGELNPADLPKSQATTTNRSVSPVTWTVNVGADMDAEEDSIIDYAAFGRMIVVEALRDGFEDALLNADTAATHQDTIAAWNPRSRWSVLGSALDHRKGFIGLRARGLDVSGASGDQSASQTVSNYMALLAQLTVPHAFGNIIYITSPEHFLAKILIDSSVLTVDKYGAAATVLTGEVAKIGGHPLVLSEFMTADLNNSGVFDNSTTDKTGLLIVNKARFVVADRRGLRIDLSRQPWNHTTWVTASERKTFHTFDGSSTKNVYYAYKLAKS